MEEMISYITKDELKAMQTIYEYISHIPGPGINRMHMLDVIERFKMVGSDK